MPQTLTEWFAPSPRYSGEKVGVRGIEEMSVSKKRRNRCEVLRGRARELRGNQNQVEAMVWEQLRGRKLRGPPTPTLSPEYRGEGEIRWQRSDRLPRSPHRSLKVPLLQGGGSAATGTHTRILTVRGLLG